MTHIEYRTENGHRYAMILAENYERMLKALEDAEDAETIRRHIETPQNTIPAELLYRILDGENPVRAWRKHRGMTQAALAGQAGIATAFLSQIETGNREMSVSTLRKLGLALDADIEFLLLGGD